MTHETHRLDNRVPDRDWAEVVSYPDGQALAVGHVKDISTGGLSLDLPVCLAPGTRVRVSLSRISPSGLLRHFHLTGKVVHAETLGFGCVHGVKFTDMTETEKTVLLDYLCQVEYQYRAAS
jgi:hypothetical protein